MSMRRQIEAKALELTEKILPCTVADRLLIERRRRINRIKECYPYAVFFSKKKSYKKYCVVRYTAPQMELMAAGIQYIFCYHQLAARGYIPIIDIEYAYSYKQGRLGEANIWDMCFKQPITAKEAAGESYVLAAGELFSYSDDAQISLDLNNDREDHFIHVRKEHFREYYAKAKKYTDPIWQVKDELLDELDREVWDKVKGRRVLGVFLRENFSRDVIYEDNADKDVYSKHPLLPGVKETIRIIREELSDWDYELICLSTQYANSLERFKEEFGDKVICIERERMDIYAPAPDNWSMSEKEIYEVNRARAAEREERIKKYLQELVILSRCNYLIGGASSGMVAALVMNGGKYDDIYILEDERKTGRY